MHKYLCVFLFGVSLAEAPIFWPLEGLEEKIMWEKLQTIYNEDADAYLVSIDALFDVLATFMLYVTIALFVGLIAYAVAVRNKSEEKLALARRTMVGVLVGYVISTICLLGFVKILYYYLDGKINDKFWLVVGMLALVAIAIVTVSLLSKKKSPLTKWFAIGFVAIFVIYAVVLVLAIPPKGDDYVIGSWTDMDKTTATILMTAFTVVLVGIMAVGAFTDKARQYDSRSLTYAAICIATSYALSYIKFFSLPQGGSVTFASLLPLMLYAFMFGPRKGVVAAVVYGLLQFVQSPQFYHPMQVLIDYPIAFGMIGLVGVAKNFSFLGKKTVVQFAFGATLAVTLRYLASVTSGWFVFGSWAMDGYNALTWALVYNLFCFADLAILLAVGVFALSSKNVLRLVNSTVA